MPEEPQGLAPHSEGPKKSMRGWRKLPPDKVKQPHPFIDEVSEEPEEH